MGPFQLSLGILLVASPALVAQEALRSAIVGDRTFDQRQSEAAIRALRPPSPDQIHWGPVLFDLGVSLGVEWNDNIRLSQFTQREDFIIRPQGDLNLRWPISNKATLEAGVGIGYEKYIEFTEYDRLNVIPDSEIAVDMLLGDVVLTLFDRISYSQDVISQPELTGQATYPRFENTIGFRASWVVRDWLLQGGYSHYNFIALEDIYEYLDRGSELFFLRGGYMIAPGTIAGVEGSVSYTDYRVNLRNDFISLSAGPFLDWTILEPLRLTVRGGYVTYLFDDTAARPAPDDVDSYYAGITLDHELTEFISHDLNVVHSLDVGINTELIQRTRGQYGIRWRFIDPARVSLGVFFERGEEARGASFLTEDYDQIGGSFGLSYNLTDHIASSLLYTYTHRTSGRIGGEYDRNSVVLQLRYRF